MKNLLKLSLVTSILIGSLYASSKRDTTLNIYGVNAKIDKNQDSSTGVGIAFDSETLKIKLESTPDFIKTGLVLKFNPLDLFYIKVGANYVDQKMYAPNDTNTRINQYSGALGTGYMINNDLYLELGGSYTKLNGKVFGDYEIVDENTNLAYLEVAKRFNLSYGTLDFTANAGQVFYEFKDDESSFGGGLDFYPTSSSKLGLMYQNEKDNSNIGFSTQYGFAFLNYSKNIDLETHQVIGGVKIAFTDMFDFSTYKTPSNIIPHLSELHAFENITFGTNMSIQTSTGAKMTQVAIDRIALEEKNTEQEVADKNAADELEAEKKAEEEKAAATKASNTVAPVLNNVSKSFSTTVGTALTLRTITASDDLDGVIAVVQSGTVDFNTVGTYRVTYTATDSANNSSTLSDTYVVNAVYVAPAPAGGGPSDE